MLRVPRPLFIGLMTLFLLGAVVPSWAMGSGSIDHVEPEESGIRVLYSIPDATTGAQPDLSSLVVTVNDQRVEASAELAATADAERTVKRTAILAIDVSQSMEGERFAEAKNAAKAFLGGVSRDVYVGIVSFAGEVSTVQEPTLDRAASVAVLDQLTLSRQTRLYDGVLEAVNAAGLEGQRSILVLSDGMDTSETPLEAVVAAVDEAGVKTDVVALAQGADAVASLEAIAAAGQGTVLPAGDPEALTAVFTSEAEALAQQVLITAALPVDFSAREGSVHISLGADGETYTDTAFVPLTDGARTSPDKQISPQAPAAPGIMASKTVMLSGLAAAGFAVLLLLLSVFGVLGGEKKESVEDRIAAYSRNSAHMPSPRLPAPAPSQGFPGAAVGIAEKALANNKGLAASVGAKLESAGVSLKPAEWLLMHAGIVFLAGLLGFLVSSGGAFVMLMFTICGGIAPWLYLGVKNRRRVGAFNEQLADTLQLLSGGLSAGLSLAQSVDTVVRQGSEPMKTEFKRALVEARLGVSIEDALDSIAERMQSRDFKWVVIAVRIQRDVGGNLSEVLSQVAATIRERAYLRRQVKSLSAEGKMSAYVLCALPIGIFVFLMLTNGVYFEPMLTSVLGWLLLAFAGVMMAVGAFWMSKLVKMEV